MSKFQDYYPEAERLAVKVGKTQRDISELLGISEKTISAWSAKGEWMRQRREYLVSTKTGPLEKLKERFAQLLEDTGDIDARKTDEIYKIQLLIDRMEGGSNVLGSAIETMDKFSKYLVRVEQDKEVIKKIGEHIHKFFEEIRRG